MMLEDGLGAAGFSLVIKNDSAAAIAALDADASRYSAVLTDIRLGKGPSGWDIARHARKLVPDMPVVYMSGDSAEEWSSMGVPDSVMIEKPFVVAQIVTAVTTLLNKTQV